MTGQGVHARAGAFDGAADAYDRGRPGYPEAALAAIERRLGLSAESTLLDLAAGTGKRVAVLYNRLDWQAAEETWRSESHVVVTAPRC